MRGLLKPFIQNKTVALVSHASWLLGRKLGARIDAHDTVIRMNYGIPDAKNSVAIGNKTDIYIYGNAGLMPELQTMFCPQITVIVNEVGADISRNNIEGIVVEYNRALHDRINDELAHIGGRKISTGGLSIMMVLEVGGFKQFDIYGHDFCATSDWTCGYTRSPDDVPPHDMFTEEYYMLKKILTSPRVRLLVNSHETKQCVMI